MSTASRGAAREHEAKRLLEKDGWAVTRGAGSHGCADLWASRLEIVTSQEPPVVDWAEGIDLDEIRFNVRAASRLRLIQVKTDKRGPFAHFGPTARNELLALAAQTGGQAELWHWPAHKKLRIYLPDEWPT